MRFLIFADLHSFDQNNLKKIKETFDVIVFLGDIPSITMRIIQARFSDAPIYGVLENHDDQNLFDAVNFIIKQTNEIAKEQALYPITDINLRKIEFEDVSFVGLQGAVKYKESGMGYTQKDALALNIPSANILFSHDCGYKIMRKRDAAHMGYKVINKYIKENKPKYNIFGHYHQNFRFEKKGTTYYCVYGCSLFDTNSGETKKIF